MNSSGIPAFPHWTGSHQAASGGKSHVVTGTAGLSINRPRRIFRASLSLRGMALIALVGSLAATGIVVTGLSRQTSGTTPPQPDTDSERLAAQPGQVAVVDGGTLVLRGRVVRLLGVEPPMRGATCKAANGSFVDCGAAATNALAALVRGASVGCQTRGQDELGRPFATCEATGTDLNRAQVAAGWARAGDALPSLKRVEDQARAGHRGLWAGR
jgi:endonuclease YncB( thermonuclease family)